MLRKIISQPITIEHCCANVVGERSFDLKLYQEWMESFGFVQFPLETFTHKNNENTRDTGGEARKYISHGSEDGWQGSMVDSPRPRNRFPFSLSPRSIGTRSIFFFRPWSRISQDTSPGGKKGKLLTRFTYLRSRRSTLSSSPLEIIFTKILSRSFSQVKNDPTIFLKIETFLINLLMICNKI